MLQVQASRPLQLKLSQAGQRFWKRIHYIVDAGIYKQWRQGELCAHGMAGVVKRGTSVGHEGQ